MNKAKKSNRPLILSIISIMLCTLLLIGSTIAWFTDTETNKGNTIEAGTLDITAQWYDVDADADSDNTDYTIGDYSFTFEDTAHNFAETDDSMISETYWQSGDVNAKLVEVINNGTLDVNIDLNAVATDLGLEDSLWFDFVAVNGTTTTGTFTVREMSSLSDVVSGYSTTLTAGNSVQFILIYGMLESAGNTYQTDMSEEIATSFTADIIVTATQTNTKEETVVYASTADDITTLNKEDIDKTVILMDDITVDSDVNLDFNVNFDLNGYTLTVPSFTMYTTDYCTVDIANGKIITTVGDIDIQIPNGTINVGNTSLASTGEHIFDASQHTLNLTGTTQLLGVTDDNGTPVADTSEVKAATIMDNTRVVVDTEEDVTLYVDADTTGVEVENTVSEGSAVLTGDGAGNTTVDGETYIVPWDGETLTEPTWYYWKNATDDDYYLYAEPVNSAWATVFEVGTAEELAWISAFVIGDIDNADSGTSSSNINYCKIILTADIDLGGFDWEPIGGYSMVNSFVFDGQGYTISNFSVDDRDHNGTTYTDKLGFFGNVGDCVIRNVNFENATITGGTYGNGVVVGFATDGTTIDNVNVYDSTVTSSCSGSNYVSGTGYVSDSCGVGAIVGMMGYDDTVETSITISNCYSNATVTSDGTSVGGIIGYAHKTTNSKSFGTVTLTNCVNEGTVTAGSTTSTNLYGIIYGTLIVDGVTQ